VELTVNDVFEVQLLVGVLYMNSPARDFVDIGPVNALFYANDFVQPGFWKLPGFVCVVVLKFSKRFYKFYL